MGTTSFTKSSANSAAKVYAYGLRAGLRANEAKSFAVAALMGTAESTGLRGGFGYRVGCVEIGDRPSQAKMVRMGSGICYETSLRGQTFYVVVHETRDEVRAVWNGTAQDPKLFDKLIVNKLGREGFLAAVRGC